MAIQKINPDDVESFTLQVNPSRTFSSSSSGLTGSVQLFARSSPFEKDVDPLSPFNDDTSDESSIRVLLDDIKKQTGSNIASQMNQYLTKVNSLSRSERKQQELEIIRFEPTTTFSIDSQRKNVIRNILYPYYRSTNPDAHWAYKNYHTLNFFTASSVPSNTVLLYPNSASINDSVIASGTYTLTDKFTFEFYINPRYTTDGPFDSFRAGTIFHLSSSYAVSLITGSMRDIDNRPKGFRLVLQVSGGTDTSPSLVTTSTSLAFMSDDNSLLKNHWHHVAIRWSATNNDHTGSFIIDNKLAGTFVIPSSSIAPYRFTSSSNPDVLCIGNFYQGNNAGNNAQSLFFNQNISQREGLVQLSNTGDLTTNTPQSFTFNHPLNAEVHELKIHSTYRTLEEISSSMSYGPTNTGSLLFYVPPFFTKESPWRRSYGTNANSWQIGGVMQTPMLSVDGTTVDPFNVAMSFGVNGFVTNLENFTRDLATKQYPRLLNLSGSEIGASITDGVTANSLLYDEQSNYFSGSIRKRNLTILPNDNGRFYPNFALLLSTSLDYRPASGTIHDRYVNDLDNLDLSLISLNKMIPTSSLYNGFGNLQSGSIFDRVAGSSPEHIGVAPGEVLTIFQRTRDPSSNAVSIFDISNLFYGQRIFPGSFSIEDVSLTGSNGKVQVTLNDNAFGSLYRANAATKHATWNNVGDIFYHEGIATVKSPALPFFGKNQFSVDFNGEHNIHIMKLNVLAAAGEVNSSSNPTYNPEFSASLLAHETDAKFVYITGINLHDDNMNIIMKTKLAQPITKRSQDKFLFKLKVDF